MHFINSDNLFTTIFAVCVRACVRACVSSRMLDMIRAVYLMRHVAGLFYNKEIALVLCFNIWATLEILVRIDSE